jgi:hypothetical protein
LTPPDFRESPEHKGRQSQEPCIAKGRRTDEGRWTPLYNPICPKQQAWFDAQGALGQALEVAGQWLLQELAKIARAQAADYPEVEEVLLYKR